MVPVEILTHILNYMPDPRHAVFVNRAFFDAWFDASTFWEKVYFFNVDDSSIDTICATLARVRCPIRSVYIEETSPSCIFRILRAIPAASKVVLHDESPYDALSRESLTSLTAVIRHRDPGDVFLGFHRLRHLDLRFENEIEVRTSRLPPLLEDLDLFGRMRVIWDSVAKGLEHVRISREDNGVQIVPLESVPGIRTLHVTASEVIVEGSSATLEDAHFNGVHIHLDSPSVADLFPALRALTCHGDFFPSGRLPDALAYLTIGVRSMELDPIDWSAHASLRDIKMHGVRCHALRCPSAIRTASFNRSFVANLFLPYLPFPVGVGWTASFAINHKMRRVKMTNSTVTIDLQNL